MERSRRIIVHIQGPSGSIEVGTILAFKPDLKPKTERVLIEGVIPVQLEWVYDQVKSILLENPGDIEKLKPYDFRPK